MRKLLILGVLAFAALGGALAQDGPPPGGGQGGFANMDPALRKKLQEYQVVFELTRTIGFFDELEKQKGLSFTKAQATKLLPILKDLQNRADLKPADANKILSNIEDNILSDAQLSWIDKTQLQRQEEARKRFQQNGGQGGQNQNGQGFGGGQNQTQNGQGQGQRQGGFGGPGGRGGMFAAIQSGKPFNPFKEQQRTKDSLVATIAFLAKK